MTMTAGEKLANTDVIPVIETRIFEGHESAGFAIGVIAVGDQIVPGLEEEFDGYRRLRGNVYALQEHYMSEDDLDADGGESDADDLRSVHLAAFENMGDYARVTGSMRLVIKSEQVEETPVFNAVLTGALAKFGRNWTENSSGLYLPHEAGTPAPLPIEEHYPDAFKNGPAPLPSNEASRVISRHEDPRVQKTVKWALFGAGVSYIAQHGLGDTYGVVKPVLARGLRMEGMPVEELGPAVFIPEYNSTKLPIRIDIPELARRLSANRPQLLEADPYGTQMTYSGVAPWAPGPHSLPAAA